MVQEGFVDIFMLLVSAKVSTITFLCPDYYSGHY